MNNPSWNLVCTECKKNYPGLELRYRCECGSTLDVVHDFEERQINFEIFDRRLGSKESHDRSGVWRFRELVLPLAADEIVCKPEGNTNLYDSKKVADYAGLDRFLLKHEGENPTASFKDRGMTVGVSIAKKIGAGRVACASTGNTSASMAAYAAQAGMKAYVFIPEGNIAYGKLSQALAYGAKTIQIAGDFDAAMDLVEKICAQEKIYLLNSINPFRIEGQKAIAFELLQDLDWQVPDWIVVPGGNLGNNSALSKGLIELKQLGLIDRLPRLAVIQAKGANPLYTAFKENKTIVPVKNAQTIATAIKIGNPISWQKSLRGIEACQGVVEEVSDQEIMDAKAHVDAAGIGAEPASCASLAGAKKLVSQGIIKEDQHVCGILTGHLLKDPDAVVGYHRGDLEGIQSNFQNAPVSTPAELQAIVEKL
jgi:threonine synthase